MPYRHAINVYFWRTLSYLWHDFLLPGATFFFPDATFSLWRDFFRWCDFFIWHDFLALICRPLLDLLQAQSGNTCG